MKPMALEGERKGNITEVEEEMICSDLYFQPASSSFSLTDENNAHPGIFKGVDSKRQRVFLEGSRPTQCRRADSQTGRDRSPDLVHAPVTRGPRPAEYF